MQSATFMLSSLNLLNLVSFYVSEATDLGSTSNYWVLFEWSKNFGCMGLESRAHKLLGGLGAYPQEIFEN